MKVSANLDDSVILKGNSMKLLYTEEKTTTLIPEKVTKYPNTFLIRRTLSQTELKGELSLAATNKQACRKMLLLHTGILRHTFLSYFFTRLKTLNILLIQALLACTMGRLLPGIGWLTKIRAIKNSLNIHNLFTEMLPIPRKG